MRTKKQLWFTTDLDFYSTEQLVRDSRETTGIISHKGRLTFKLKKYPRMTFQVMNSGKFSISYPLKKNPDEPLTHARHLLAKENGTPITKLEKYKEIPEPKPKRAPLETKAEKTLTLLRFLLMRDPTLTELAYEVGVTPEKVREVAFKLSPKTKWKEPTKEQIKEGERKLKEIYQIASLLKHFKKEVVLRRPVSHLGGMLRKDVLKRVDYALKHEIEELPTIKFREETEERKEFEFIWSRESKYRFTTYPEYYYKKTRQLSGDIWLNEIMKKTLNEINKTLGKLSNEE